jgi:maltodextrin utilization protein YvdJ
MVNGNDGTDILIQQIDELLSKDTTQIKQKDALCLVLATTRAVLKQVTTERTRVDKIKDRVDLMWPAYRVMIWLAAVLGISVIALLFSLATGQASIIIK